MGLVAVGVVLVSTLVANVVLVVHMFGVLLCVVVSLDPIGLVQTLGLGELVDLSTGETGQEFLGSTVADGLACFQLV